MTTKTAILFEFSALAFNLLIGAIYIAQRKRKIEYVNTLRKILIALILPFTFVLVQYLTEGTNILIRIFLALGLAYLLDELVMVVILKIDLRAKWITHIPYILLQITALCGLIYIAFFISNTWGWVISITFWIAIVCLIFFYTGRRKKMREV